MEKHVVIIGSGLGGLSCGYILAKKGFRVTILEKQYCIGGCLQTFVRDGVKFETGMHYIGSMDPGLIQNRFFRYFKLLDDVRLRRLNTSGYDVISLAGERFPLANGEENFVETLTRFFPTEKENLSKYCRYVKSITDYSSFYSTGSQTKDIFLDSRFIMSASDYVSSVTNNVTLQNVLSGQLPLYGGVRKKTPLYVHALIHDYYDKGAFRIVGGSDVVARSLATSITEMGGAVYTKRKVVKINCDDTHAVSVSVEGEDEPICADYIFADIHPNRFLELLDTPLIRKSYRSRLLNLENTVSCFTVYIRFKENTMPYQNFNLFHTEQSDVWSAADFDPSRKNPIGFLYMHGCSSLEQKYAESGILVSYMDFSEVERWRGSKIGLRGEDYEDFKHGRAEFLLDMLERQCPGTRSAIKNYYTSSPLTYLDYNGTERGSMYGILVDCQNLVGSRVLPQTKIPNVFLTGQNTNMHGMLGVMIGSVLSVRNIVDVSDILDVLHEES